MTVRRSMKVIAFSIFYQELVGSKTFLKFTEVGIAPFQLFLFNIALFSVSSFRDLFLLRFVLLHVCPSNIYIYIYIYIYLYIYIYIYAYNTHMYIHIYIYIYLYMFFIICYTSETTETRIRTRSVSEASRFVHLCVECSIVLFSGFSGPRMRTRSASAFFCLIIHARHVVLTAFCAVNATWLSSLYINKKWKTKEDLNSA